MRASFLKPVLVSEREARLLFLNFSRKPTRQQKIRNLALDQNPTRNLVLGQNPTRNLALGQNPARNLALGGPFFGARGPRRKIRIF